MASINKVLLLGNLGRDPELSYLQDGKARCRLSIATTERYKGADGQAQERTTWHTVIAWGKTAENCAKYLGKGRTVFVEGRIDNRSYDGKDGQKHYLSEVVADRVQFIGGGGGSERRGPPSAGRSNIQRPNLYEEPPGDPGSGPVPGFDPDDDIPF